MRKLLLITIVTTISIIFSLTLANIINEPLPGELVENIEIKNGAIGKFRIGETKESILKSMKDQSFSPIPKPDECQQNWINISKIVDQRAIMTPLE